MSRPISARSAGLAALVVPLVAAGWLASAGPASAIPFEGDADPASCIRVMHRSALFPEEQGIDYVGLPYVAMLVPRAEC